MTYQILFVGEQRSKKAIEMGVHWEDGRLAAKQLFDALKGCGINPAEHKYVNILGRKNGANMVVVTKHNGPVVGMGLKVCQILRAMGVGYFPMVHPAARGTIRRKEVFLAHVQNLLTDIEAQRNS